MAAQASKLAPGFSAFISHAKADAKKAKAMADGLEKRGFKCWIAPRDVKPGRSYGDEIIRGIESTRSFVLVLSKASNDSAFVAREVERAVSKKKPIFAVRIADVQPAPALELFISGTQWIDAFPGRVGSHVDRLASLLAEEEGRNDKPEPGKDRPQPPVLPKLAVPIGAAAALLVLGAGLALWSGHEPSPGGDRIEPAVLTTPVPPENPEIQTRQTVAAAEPDINQESKSGGAPDMSGAYGSKATASNLSAGDPDFRACEKSSGDDAIAACDRAIASGKFTGRSLSYLYSDRGFMRMQKGELDLALADLDDAARIDSTNFYAFWNRGAVYTAKGDFDRAQQDLAAALTLKPDKTSKAQIEEAMNVVLAVAKAAKTEADDPSVITVPTWGNGQGIAGSAASSYPTDARPSLPSALGAAPPMAITPALPAAPPATAIIP